MATTSTLAAISSMAMRPLLAELLPQYARDTGIAVALEAVGGVDAARRVAAGEAFDVAFLARPALDALASAGRAGAAVDLARSSIAVAVRAGAPAPDLTSEDTLRRAVAAASSVGYSTGPSGEHVLALLRRWGLDGAHAPRLVRAAPGVPVGKLLVDGEATLAFQQLGELRGVPGIEVAGLLPAGAQAVTVFGGAAITSTACAHDVQALLAWLAAPARAEAKARHGLDG